MANHRCRGDVVFAFAFAGIACCFLESAVVGLTFSSKLVHRYSLEVRNGAVLPGRRRSLEYAEKLLSSDLKQQRMRLGARYGVVFPSEGGITRSYGNDLEWLHYTWIDIGNPNVSFLVGLDVGSDLLWVPCECIQCAPLSASNYTVLERDLGEYHPSKSGTSKNLTCGHQLCDSSTSCKGPNDLCPYILEYGTDNTSSSGYLIQENIHLTLVNQDASQNRVQAAIVMGCGRKQTVNFLSGAAPDGLMGLGPGSISVPSLLANTGLIRNSFSICFGDNDTGRLLFGDQGPASQQSTPFLAKGGIYETYFVRVESYCVGSFCLKQSSFRALVDSGSSFTYLPGYVYEKMILEFDKQLKSKRTTEGFLDNCYNASSKDLLNIPSMRLMFAKNQSFSAHDFIISPQSGVECLSILRSEFDFGIIGQNFMIGHLMVFDRENSRLGWCRSDCQDTSDRTSVDISPPPGGESHNPLPASEQQSKHNSTQAIAPAVAVRASPKPSSASHQRIRPLLCLACLLLLLVCLI